MIEWKGRYEMVGVIIQVAGKCRVDDDWLRRRGSHLKVKSAYILKWEQLDEYD